MSKSISGFEDYSITTEGVIFNSKRNRFISNHKGSKGYRLSFLYKDRIRHTKKLHRLVAEAFIPNPNKCPQVNHKDGNKLNNRVSNLEWCTNTQNKEHAILNGLVPRGESASSARLTNSQVMEIRRSFCVKNISELSRQYKVDRRTIRNIRDGKTWSHL